jgi:hypothetical protein
MTMLITTLAAAGTVLVTSAFAQNARSADQIEHHIAKIDGTRFHYMTAGTGVADSGLAPELDRLAEGPAFAGQRRPPRRRTRPSRVR